MQVLGKDMEEMELTYTIGEKVKCYNHFWKQFESFLKSQTYVYHMISQFF